MITVFSSNKGIIFIIGFSQLYVRLLGLRIEVLVILYRRNSCFFGVYVLRSSYTLKSGYFGGIDIV